MQTIVAAQLLPGICVHGHRHLVLELHPEFIDQGSVGPPEDMPGEPWHLQFPADGFQATSSDVYLVDGCAGLGDKDKIVWAGKPGPAPQPEEDGKQ